MKEYSNPVVQQAVHALISEEMRTFAPSKAKYLSHLPYPEVQFKRSPLLQVNILFYKVIIINLLCFYFQQAEFQRIVNGIPSIQFDSTRYSVDQPLFALEKDVQVCLP